MHLLSGRAAATGRLDALVALQVLCVQRPPRTSTSPSLNGTLVAFSWSCSCRARRLIGVCEHLRSRYAGYIPARAVASVRSSSDARARVLASIGIFLAAERAGWICAAQPLCGFMCGLALQASLAPPSMAQHTASSGTWSGWQVASVSLIALAWLTEPSAPAGVWMQKAPMRGCQARARLVGAGHQLYVHTDAPKEVGQVKGAPGWRQVQVHCWYAQKSRLGSGRARLAPGSGALLTRPYEVGQGKGAPGWRGAPGSRTC